MVDLLNKIVEYVEKLDTRLDSIEKELVKQGESLRHHIYRSDLADERMDRQEMETKQELRSIRKEMEPVKIHVNRMDGALRFIGIIATIVAIVSALYRFFI